jgi:hypothetical protein
MCYNIVSPDGDMVSKVQTPGQILPSKPWQFKTNYNVMSRGRLQLTVVHLQR